MSDLLRDIKLVQHYLAWTDAGNSREAIQDETLHEMTMRFARFLPSPSKLNAVSVLKSNIAEKLTAWLEENEEASRLQDERFKEDEVGYPHFKELLDG